MLTEQSLLKQDVRGRVQTPVARREALLAEFARSGVSGAKFAVLVGVKYSTFAAWVARRKRAGCKIERNGKGRAAGRGSALRLVEALVPAGCEVRTTTSSSEPLSVRLGGGMRLELTDESQVRLAAALLKALEAVRPC